MTKIYMDVTNLMQVNFLTGIQRVVREITLRFLKDERLDIILIAYAKDKDCFEFLNRDKFNDYFGKEIGDIQSIHTGKPCTLEDMESGSIFYDMDSAWHSPKKRSILLPQLKNRGIKLAVFFYDIIPVSHPQFVHQNTIISFMEYLGAYLKYADIITTSTYATLDSINELMDRLNLKRIPGVATWYGVDFFGAEEAKQGVSEDALKAAESGKYILMVGTIEPRKNHKLILNAFDSKLFEQGYNLVLAGHFGWDIEILKERILTHPLLGKQLFYVENSNNITIDYLYRNAYMLAFPSFVEGFGLPVVEALGRGIPVAASNHKVIYEIGKGYAEFFSPQEERQFINIVMKYHNNPELYAEWKKKIANYEVFTWEQAEEQLADALVSLQPEWAIPCKKKVRQMVMLTARAEDFMHTLPYIEAHMPFIQEIVVCCPDKIIGNISEEYQGSLQLSFLPDSVVLAGNPLPEDHQLRNFFLRCMLMKQDVLDEVFIMSDDDYRPLYPISEDVFFEGNKYKAFYFYEMNKWRGCQGEPTSFDIGVYKTQKFCEDNNYPTMQFNSHTPQIIERKMFLEMMEKHPGIEKQGFDEWSTYFNYLMAHYPNKVEFRKYEVMNWPGSVTDWTMYCQPEKYVFENYYNYIYSSRGLFAGIDAEYGKTTLKDNEEKVKRAVKERTRYNSDKQSYIEYTKRYAEKSGEYPVFCITNALGKAQIILPGYIEFVQNSCNRIDVGIVGMGRWIESPQKIEFSYYFIPRIGKGVYNDRVVKACTDEEFIEVPFVAPEKPGKYKLCCQIKIGETEIYSQANVKIMESRGC